MTSPADSEVDRIRAEYQRRAREIPADFYSLDKPANLFSRHNQERMLLAALRGAQLIPLRDRLVLEVGCGTGQWFSMFQAFGVSPERISGIELDQNRAAVCRQKFPRADVREGDACQLPWHDEFFDVVLQSTVFTSLLNPLTKQRVASEMLRVLKSDGCIVWYDFSFNNPSNSQVRGVGRREIQQLFPNCELRLSRTTLAPPLARRLVPWSWLLAQLLEQMKFLNTHYLGIIRKPPKSFI